jgi:hypothetical protein
VCVCVKVRLSLCFLFSRTPRHKGVLGEWRYSSTHSLTLALDGGEWSASRPGRFTSREESPVTHWIGRCLGSRAGLDVVSKRKIPSPCQDSNPEHPVAQSYSVAMPTELCILNIGGTKNLIDYTDFLSGQRIMWKGYISVVAHTSIYCLYQNMPRL